MVRKLLATLLVLVMALGIVPLAGAQAEPYTLVYYWIGNGDTDQRPLVEQAINDYIGPIINAKVDFHIIGWGDWATKALTAIQAGEKIDIFFTADWQSYTRSVSQGTFLPLNDPNGEYGNLLEEYGKDILAGINPGFITGTQINGVNYAVPTQKELTVPMGWVYNVSAAEEVGMDPATIKTEEDFEPYLAKFKELHPDQYPLLNDGGWGGEPWVAGWASGLGGNVITQRINPDDNGVFDETIYSVWETEDNAKHAALMYKWAQAGYINPDSQLTSYTITDEFNAGKFLVVTQPLKGDNIKGQELVNASGNPDLKVDEIYGQKKVNITTHAGGSMLAIPVTSEDPVTAMKFINMMHHDTKLLDMMLFGVEGVHWEREADGRVAILNAAWNGATAGAWTLGNTEIQSVSNKEDPEKNKLLAAYSDDSYNHPSLGFRFNQEPVDGLVVALNNVVEGWNRALLTGAIDPATGIPEYVEALKAAGLDEIKAELQKQYDEWKVAKAAK